MAESRNESLGSLGLAPGRPEKKKSKALNSYKRISYLLKTANGELTAEERMKYQSILSNRANRLKQLAGEEQGHSEALQTRRKVHMLRTSTKAKMYRVHGNDSEIPDLLDNIGEQGYNKPDPERVRVERQKRERKEEDQLSGRYTMSEQEIQQRIDELHKKKFSA